MKVNHKVYQFSAPGVLKHDGKFSGWIAKNVGTVSADVLGIPLAPGETLDMTHVPADAAWNTDITVGFASASAKVFIITLTYA